MKKINEKTVATQFLVVVVIELKKNGQTEKK